VSLLLVRFGLNASPTAEMNSFFPSEPIAGQFKGIRAQHTLCTRWTWNVPEVHLFNSHLHASRSLKELLSPRIGISIFLFDIGIDVDLESVLPIFVAT
jgi:hypothetical protein